MLLPASYWSSGPLNAKHNYFFRIPCFRFKTDTRLCLSISDYHPDTWNPAWCVATILTGLLSFMLEKQPTLGSVETSEFQKKQFALKSHEFNLRNKTFVELFPEVVETSRATLEKRRKESEIRRASKGQADPDDPLSGARSMLEQNQGLGLQSAVTNFLVIGGFAAFAFVVQYVLKSIAASSD